MNIAHVGLACYFTENMTYQDNQLSQQNVRDGHQVLYISNAAKYVDGKIVNTGYEDAVLESGIRLVRLPYQRIMNYFVSDKVRKVEGLYSLLEDFSPDVILSHDLCYWSVLDVIRYKKDHPAVKFYADTHTAAYNSGTNWLSLHVLHRLFYRHLVQKALPYLEKYFYIGEGERKFSLENYGIPESLMEFYPLGGNILADADYAEKRARRRAELGLGEEELLFAHSGKLDTLKRTEELLGAFGAVKNPKFHLAVIGSIPKDMEQKLMPLLKTDSRVEYLGWKSGADLQEYLCACDLYCQPGSVSATMQNAVCCSCAVMAYPHEPYTKNLDFGNILWVKTQADMEQVFYELTENSVDLLALKENSKRCARELLDYKKLAARLYR